MKIKKRLNMLSRALSKVSVMLINMRLAFGSVQRALFQRCITLYQEQGLVI